MGRIRDESIAVGVMEDEERIEHVIQTVGFRDQRILECLSSL